MATELSGAGPYTATGNIIPDFGRTGTPGYGPGVGQAFDSPEKAALVAKNLNYAYQDTLIRDGKASLASQTLSSPTVLTDANIRETTVPNILSDYNKLVGTPTTGSSANSDSTKNDGSSTSGLNLDPSSPTYLSDLYKSATGGSDNSDAQDELSVLAGMKSSSDAATASNIGNIQSAYDERMQTLKESQDSKTNSLTRSLMLGGSTRYAPVSSSGILSSKESSDAKAIADLQNKESQAITQAQIAKSNNDYKALSESLSIIKSLRTEKNTLASTLAKNVGDYTKKLQQNAFQSKRDDAIATQIQNGVTDPTEIMNALNKADPNANFTAKEIEATLKELSPTSDVAGLSGSVKDFFVLSGQGRLPGTISSLPQDEQLAAYLHYVKQASSISNPKTTGAKITLSTAKTLGLPLSTVGMTQADVVDSLKGSTPPAWFIEKLNTQGGAGTDPEATSTAWNAFKTQENARVEGTAAKSNPSYQKASQYFNSTYSGLSTDELDKISQQVVTYVNGGMTYAKAVAQTEKDLSQ